METTVMGFRVLGLRVFGFGVFGFRAWAKPLFTHRPDHQVGLSMNWLYGMDA